MLVYTIKHKTVIFNQNGGVHGDSPIQGVNALLQVTENTRDVPNRGKCYRVLDNGAFVLVSDVTLAAPPPVDPPPPTPVPTVPADVDIVLATGSTVNVKDTNGTIIFSYTAP